MNKLITAMAIVSMVPMISIASASDLCTNRGGEVLLGTIQASGEVLRICSFNEMIEGKYPMNSFIGDNDLAAAVAGKQTLAVHAFKVQAAGDRAGTDLGVSICKKVTAQPVGVVFSKYPNSGVQTYCRFQDGSIVESLTLIAGPRQYSKLGNALK